MENSGDEGFLSGRARVSKEPKVLAGKSNRGDVINATERKAIESGDLRSNDRHGVSNNRIAEKVSPNNRWESWGVMNMVGRVLGGKMYMDDEVEKVNDYEAWGQMNLVRDLNSWRDMIGERASENNGEVNSDADMNTWQDVTGEPTSASEIDIKATNINSDSVKLDLDCPVEGNSLNVNRYLISNEIVPDVRLESEEINDAKADIWKLEACGKIEELIDVKANVLIQKGCGAEDLLISEILPDVQLETKELNDVKADVLIQKGCGAQDLLVSEILPDFRLETEEVNDVMADILTPEDCGEETEKIGEYHVSDLVWGKVKSHPWWPGQIFAPSAASDKAKEYFKKESYLVAYFGDESFAWNEGSKLMPFHMHFSKLEKQSHTDGFSHAVSCALDEAARRVEFGLSCPCLEQEVRDEIKFQIFENAGIREESSIRSGGDSASSVATFSLGDALQFLESLAKCPLSKYDRLQFTISKAQLLAYSRWKGRHQLPVFEELQVLLEDGTQFNVMGEGNDSMEVMEGILPCPVSDAANDDSSKNIKSMAKTGSSRKRKEISGDEECPRLKEKSMSALMSSESSTVQNGDKKRAKRTFTKVYSSTSRSSECKKRKTLVSTGVATSGIDVALASNGAGKFQIAGVVSAEITTPDMVLSKLILAAKKPMQGHDAMIPVIGWLREFRDSICLEKSSLTAQQVEAGFGGTEDSYWTDRIIQSYSQDPTMFGSQKPYEMGAQLESDVAAFPKLDDNKENYDFMDLDTGNQTVPKNVVSEEYRPTALILKFKNLESIPSVENLNEIFSRYGILYESETKILSRSKCVKVIFKRPEDADTAFSSAGKYSIFGPSLVSYRLRYVTLPQQKTSKKKKKVEQDKEGTSQKVDAV